MLHEGIRIFTRQDELGFRKELRKQSTAAEALLWKRLKAGQVEGLKFRRQHSIGSYVMDFYCPHLKPCIELDGNVHDSEAAREHDDVRTEFINHYGITVLRFSNEVVLDGHIDRIIHCIIAFSHSPKLIKGYVKDYFF